MHLDEATLEKLERDVSAATASVASKSDLEMLRRDWLSKDGTIKILFQKLRDVPPEAKPRVAARLNALKERLETFIVERESSFGREQLEAGLKKEFADLTLPGLYSGLGSPHPVTLLDFIYDVLSRGNVTKDGVFTIKPGVSHIC